MVKYNHHQEVHIDGLDVESIQRQPFDLIITDTPQASSAHIGESSLEQRSELTNQILDILTQMSETKGNLVILCHPAERMFEVLIIFYEIWKQNKDILKDPILYYRNLKNFLNIVEGDTVYLRKDIPDLIDLMQNSNRSSNFFSHLEMFNLDQRISELRSRVLVFSYRDMLMGPGFNTFIQMIQNQNNHLLILGRPSSRSNQIDTQLKRGFRGQLNFQQLTSPSTSENETQLLEYFMENFNGS